jgi:Protein of unknown function (DUF2752)
LTKFAGELRRALLAVWLIMATVCGATAAAPFVVNASALQGLFPTCEARVRNSRCVACGMTTGFIAISDGRWADARQANAASIPLYGGFLMNFMAAVAYSIRKLGSGGTKCKF